MTWRIGALIAVVVLVVGAVAAVIVPRFGTDTIDRSQPALLQSVRDLSQYHAAAGEFQVVLDIENDVRYVPAALAGKRTLFVAAGSVNAYVDFAGIEEKALRIDQEHKTVEVDLPAPALDKPNLHQEKCYVFAQERGLWDRLTDMVETTDQQPFYVAAEEKIAAAAKESGILAKASDNTRKMLSGLLGALGYQVTFAKAD
ncbi:DUF4230 domain-containing protein [Saccharothrix violaceirubra]|uniref:DUF4230 domain-containing protein n=1 Tax=Saccharothrix violaceirubra TaxID=413306 RepID=A0A7W7WUM1_9PSEU|nr:DUF4230 domain-containing protein [Saccharothrix violaceirubra]MBB4964475.1 hypothetical protein [Saccharothrix violaceirubra]